MSPRLPTDVLELVLRSDEAWSDERGIGLDTALDQRRLLYRAAFVSRSWHAVATRKLAETIIVTRWADLSTLECAIEREYLQGDRVRTLIVDDSEIEEYDARATAWRTLEAAAVASGQPFARTAVNVTAVEMLMDEVVPAELAAFAARLGRLGGSMPQLTTVMTAFARTINILGQHPHVQRVTIHSTALRLRLYHDEWHAPWPQLSSTVTHLRIDDLGGDSTRMPMLPAQWLGLRQARFGSRRSPLGFSSSLFQAPAVHLTRLDVSLEVIIDNDPRALFRIHATDTVAMPNLRCLRVGINGDALTHTRIGGFMAMLPPSLVALEFDMYELDGDALDDGRGPVSIEVAAPALANFLSTAIDAVPSTSALCLLALHIDDFDAYDLDELRTSAAVFALAAACAARGVRFEVDQEHAGMF